MLQVSQTKLNQLCREVGLDAVGVATTTPPDQQEAYLQWLAAGMHGEMHYMQKHASLRLDPTKLLPGARSILCFAWSYNSKKQSQGGETKRKGKVARYALGRDYHQLLKTKMRQFWQLFSAEFGLQARARFCVDTAPVLEREYAARAGIGWIGKNAMLMDRKLGSYLFLGEILTDLELTPSQPSRAHCGSCTACLDACPTGALVAPYTLDSRKCIAYLTIEKRGDFTQQEKSMVAEHLFGCDICQEVCPWNRDAVDGDFYNAGINPLLIEGDLNKLQTPTATSFWDLIGDSPLERCGHKGWQRNLDAVQDNLTAARVG